MLVPVTDIGAEGLEVDRTVPPAGAMEISGQPLHPDPARVRGRVQAVGLGFEFRGKVETAIQLPCSRCLEAYRLALSLPFEIVYREAGEPVFPVTEDRGDPGVSYLDEGRIDLAQLVEEQIYLAVPLKPLCRTDCRGLCPQCGTQWNREECDCKADALDPRWSALRELKKDLSGTGRPSR